METKEDLGKKKAFKKKIKTLKRDELKKILGSIKEEKNYLNGLVQKWWNGQEITLQDKTDFYHSRLFLKKFELDRAEYLRADTSGEYVDASVDMCQADNKNYKDSIEEGRKYVPLWKSL